MPRNQVNFVVTSSLGSRIDAHVERHGSLSSLARAALRAYLPVPGLEHNTLEKALPALSRAAMLGPSPYANVEARMRTILALMQMTPAGESEPLMRELLAEYVRFRKLQRHEQGLAGGLADAGMLPAWAPLIDTEAGKE